MIGSIALVSLAMAGRAAESWKARGLDLGGFGPVAAFLVNFAVLFLGPLATVAALTGPILAWERWRDRRRRRSD